MSSKEVLKRVHGFKSDAEAEKFVAKADLTDYDLSQFTRTRFELDKKTAEIRQRLDEA
jgi:predicted DNA binding CopG/RHH family protein